MIKSYFDKVRGKIKAISPLVKSETISFDMVSPEMGIIKGRIVFLDGSIFDFREILSHKDHDYRFHWMDRANKLIVRWDSAPHHKKLENFPFHKHEGRDVMSFAELNLIDALNHIRKLVIRRLSMEF